jgi:plastocyanin
MTSVRLVAVVSALVLLGSACGSDDSNGGGGGGDGGGGATVEVTAQDFSFDPTTVELEPGAETTVTLVNEGEQEHSFTSEELDIDVEAEGGEEAETTVTAPDSGSFDFFCRYHADQMKGTISVGGEASGAGGGGSKKAESKDEAKKDEAEDGPGGYDY